jgi:hypothetical protein
LAPVFLFREIVGDLFRQHVSDPIRDRGVEAAKRAAHGFPVEPGKFDKAVTRKLFGVLVTLQFKRGDRNKLHSPYAFDVDPSIFVAFDLHFVSYRLNRLRSTGRPWRRPSGNSGR